MGIFATGAGFGLGLGDYKYIGNKDGSLSLVAGKRKYPLSVTTNRGIFLEVVDEDGDIVQTGGDGDWFYVVLGKKPVTLRYKRLPDPALTPSQIKKARHVVTRYLVDGMPYSLNIPDTLSGTIGWMQENLALIPENSRAKASFRFDTSTSHGDTYPNIEITYSEPESDDEVIDRVKIERERERLAVLAKRAQLEKLQHELEPVA